MTPEIREKASKITVLILDVDGVLTDGKIYYGNHGDELQSFHILDGMGLGLWHKAGYRSAIISGRKTKMVVRRAKVMGVNKVCQGVRDKVTVSQEIAKKWGVLNQEICFIGDDVIDLPVMKDAGFSVAVANAVEGVKKVSDYVTECRGGEGAVREVIDLILQAKGDQNGDD